MKQSLKEYYVKNKMENLMEGFEDNKNNFPKVPESHIPIYGQHLNLKMALDAGWGINK